MVAQSDVVLRHDDLATHMDLIRDQVGNLTTLLTATNAGFLHHAQCFCLIPCWSGARCNVGCFLVQVATVEARLGFPPSTAAVVSSVVLSAPVLSSKDNGGGGRPGSAGMGSSGYIGAQAGAGVGSRCGHRQLMSDYGAGAELKGITLLERLSRLEKHAEAVETTIARTAVSGCVAHYKPCPFQCCVQCCYKMIIDNSHHHDWQEDLGSTSAQLGEQEARIETQLAHLRADIKQVNHSFAC